MTQGARFLKSYTEAVRPKPCASVVQKTFPNLYAEARFIVLNNNFELWTTHGRLMDAVQTLLGFPPAVPGELFRAVQLLEGARAGWPSEAWPSLLSASERMAWHAGFLNGEPAPYTAPAFETTPAPLQMWSERLGGFPFEPDAQDYTLDDTLLFLKTLIKRWKRPESLMQKDGGLLIVGGLNESMEPMLPERFAAALDRPSVVLTRAKMEMGETAAPHRFWRRFLGLTIFP